MGTGQVTWGFHPPVGVKERGETLHPLGSTVPLTLHFALRCRLGWADERESPQSSFAPSSGTWDIGTEASLGWTHHMYAVPPTHPTHTNTHIPLYRVLFANITAAAKHNSSVWGGNYTNSLLFRFLILAPFPMCCKCQRVCQKNLKSLTRKGEKINKRKELG